MSKVIHNNIFFNLNQPKIFHLVEYQISNDDPVRKLSKILEAMNFNKLMQVFSHKTKIHPVRMFAVILSRIPEVYILQEILKSHVMKILNLDFCYRILKFLTIPLFRDS